MGRWVGTEVGGWVLVGRALWFCIAPRVCFLLLLLVWGYDSFDIFDIFDIFDNLFKKLL